MEICDICGGEGSREIILIQGRDGVTNEVSSIMGTAKCTACDGQGGHDEHEAGI